MGDFLPLKMVIVEVQVICFASFFVYFSLLFLFEEVQMDLIIIDEYTLPIVQKVIPSSKIEHDRPVSPNLPHDQLLCHLTILAPNKVRGKGARDWLAVLIVLAIRARCSCVRNAHVGDDMEEIGKEAG